MPLQTVRRKPKGKNWRFSSDFFLHLSFLQLYQYIYENHPAIVFFASNQTELRWGQSSVPEQYPRITMRDATLLAGPILMDNRKIIIVTFSWYDIPNSNIAIVVRKRHKFGQTTESTN